MAKSIAQIKSLGEDNPKVDKEVSKKLREDWNTYTSWLEKKGYKGHPSLDKNDLGGKMIDMYRRESPTTSVSRATIKPIQEELSKYREYSLNLIKNKKALINDRWVLPNENLDYYMKDLSVVDGIAGQRTTKHNFPKEYLNHLDASGKLINTENKGFATIK
jgi:hypothetical protein